ncbi:MAG TPA: hypothetical protein VE689_02595 [Candidatus Udaeobacter sp.]|jgi:hypothetical protein|nr:hypothetical protein [Candidatus Udaeobacter sp.]
MAAIQKNYWTNFRITDTQVDAFLRVTATAEQRKTSVGGQTQHGKREQKRKEVENNK